MPKLRIFTKKISFLFPTSIHLLLDEKNIRIVGSDERIETDVSFGNHSIQLKSKYFSSELKVFKMDVKKEIEISIKYFLFFKITQLIFFLAISLSIFFQSKLLFYLSDTSLFCFFILLILKRKDIFLIKEVN